MISSILSRLSVLIMVLYTWNNAGLLSIRLLGTNLNEIRITILSFSFKKMPLKLSSAKKGGHFVQGEMS